MPDLVIRGGTVITPQGPIQADISIEGESIAGVGHDVAGGAREIDAAALTVFPGLIDVHVHFNEPGREEWEGAVTGSAAFASAGGTLFFDMPHHSSPCTVGAEEFHLKCASLQASSITDFGLWGGIVPGNRDALKELAECGVVGFKAIMCESRMAEFPRADDLTLYEGMRAAAALDLPVAVHAENEEITGGLIRRLKASARHDIPAFLVSRPVIAEVEAIQRAGIFAREAGCRLHVAHISSGAGVAAALEARARGVRVSIETCPHYLFFTEDDVARIGELAKCEPPLRSAVQRESLWEFVRNGQVDIVSSDHSPCPPEMKEQESFFDVWGGIAGIQSTLAVLIEEGVFARSLSIDRVAALTATNPAALFHIERKGSIEIGKDADLTLMDIHAARELTEDVLFQRHRISPYLGTRFRGIVQSTIRRGEMIYSRGMLAPKSRGKFVRPDRKEE